MAHPKGNTLTPGEAADELGVSARTFSRHQKAGEYKHLELSKPIGLKRYSRALVEQFANGQRVTNFGRGRFTDRRAS